MHLISHAVNVCQLRWEAKLLYLTGSGKLERNADHDHDLNVIYGWIVHREHKIRNRDNMIKLKAKYAVYKNMGSTKDITWRLVQGISKTTPYSLFTSVLVLVIRDYGLVERLNG